MMNLIRKREKKRRWKRTDLATKVAGRKTAVHVLGAIDIAIDHTKGSNETTKASGADKAIRMVIVAEGLDKFVENGLATMLAGHHVAIIAQRLSLWCQRNRPRN